MSAIFDVLAGIGDFFAMIGDFFVSVVDLVIDLFSDLGYVIGLLGSFVLEIDDFFGWLPQEALIVLITCFSLVVIYMILNRK